MPRFTDAIRRLLRSTGKPFDLRHPSGEIEDETGSRRPGFRSALPRVEHSDGWRLTDLWVSPEHPDPAAPPPTIRCEDATGAAEMPRRIAIRGDRRLRVLVPQQLRWVGARSGDAMTAEARARILDRVRSAYDEWGRGREIR